MSKPSPFIFPPGTKSLVINPDVLPDAKTAKPNRFGGSKYGAAKATYKGRTYDSKAEAKRAEALDGMQAAGVIRWWQPKPGSFHLGVPENVYRPDFLVVGLDAVWIEDVKGMETAKFKRDKKLWRAYGPCPLHLINGKKVEVIEPKG